MATPLATLARNLVDAIPTVIGRSTRRRTSWRRRAAISTGVPDTRRRPPTSRNASSIDMPSTSGVVDSNTSNTARDRLGVGRHPRLDDDDARAEAPRLASTHRRADAEGPRLVARRQHDTTADDDGAPAQAGVVALLDRRVEGVEIGVQDARLRPRSHEHMFAFAMAAGNPELAVSARGRGRGGQSPRRRCGR